MHIIDLRDNPKYLPGLAHWHHAEWSYLNPTRTVEQRMAGMREHLTDDLVPSTFVAVHEQPLGSASIVASDMDTHRELTPWLASVFVEPERRKQGIGTMLVIHVMSMARAAGIERLYLFTPDAVAFYERMGWTVLAREEYRGHPVTIMEIDLTV